MAIDEFANLGKLETVEEAASYIRSYGVRLLCIIQNIGQLKEAGYENKETFIGNSECCWWFATNHSDNKADLEERLGQKTIKEKIGPPWWWRRFSGRQSRYSLTERKVMTADQIGRLLESGNLIVTRGKRPFILKPDPYFKALPVCFYDADNDHRETWLRMLTRALFQRVLGREDDAGREARPHSVEPPRPTFQEPQRPPLRAASVSPRNSTNNGMDAEFHRLLAECFEETSGAYPHPPTRQKIWHGFRAEMSGGSDFFTLQTQLEEWMSGQEETYLPRQRAEHAILFFDQWVEQYRKKRTA